MIEIMLVLVSKFPPFNGNALPVFSVELAQITSAEIPNGSKMKRPLLLRVCFLLTAGSLALDDDHILLWASCGAGFRAMPLLMAFANVFAKAGLINESFCRFNSFSGASSASWFSTPFFFSHPFFQRTIANDTQVLFDSVAEWVDSRNSVYDIFGDLFERGLDSTLVDILLRGKLSFYHYLEAMMEATASGFGDPDFFTRPASHETRIPAMSETDFYISFALTQSFRTRGGLGWFQDSLTFLGPSDSDDVFTGSIPYQFAVKKNSTSFYVSIEERRLPIRTCVTRNPPIWFNAKQWDDWPMYPRNASVGSYLLSKEKIPECFETGEITQPFGGQPPTTVMAALMGSTPMLELSGLSPVSMAQAISTSKQFVRASGRSERAQRRQNVLMDLYAQALYLSAGRIGEYAMCNQFPYKCGIHDPLFSHSGTPDIAALAQSISQHQQKQSDSKDGNDLNTIKAVVTYLGTSVNGFLQYFNTTFNQGISPGEYIWLPYADTNFRSMQIFDEYFNYSKLWSTLTPIEGLPISTAIINLTTIDNPMLQIRAGQSVQMLLLVYTEEDLTVNKVAPINSTLFGQEAKAIADNAEVLSIVQNFLAL